METIKGKTMVDNTTIETNENRIYANDKIKNILVHNDLQYRGIDIDLRDLAVYLHKANPYAESSGIVYAAHAVESAAAAFAAPNIYTATRAAAAVDRLTKVGLSDNASLGNKEYIHFARRVCANAAAYALNDKRCE